MPLHLVKRPQDAAVTHATSQHTILLEYHLSSNRLTKNRSDLLSLTLCTSGHSAKPQRPGRSTRCFRAPPWFAVASSTNFGAAPKTCYSKAPGPRFHLHATAKPLCRVQIPDITVWLCGVAAGWRDACASRLAGGVSPRRSPLEPLVGWQAHRLFEGI